MATIPDSVRDFLAAGLWAHVVTMKRNGQPHVNLCWAGIDGDELVFASFFDAKRAARVRRDPRVTLSFHAKELRRNGLVPVPRDRRSGRPSPTAARSRSWTTSRSGTSARGDVPEPRHAPGLDLPGHHRQDLWPGSVERALGRDGPRARTRPARTTLPRPGRGRRRGARSRPHTSRRTTRRERPTLVMRADPRSDPGR